MVHSQKHQVKTCAHILWHPYSSKLFFCACYLIFIRRIAISCDTSEKDTHIRWQDISANIDVVDYIDNYTG
jgi:hypothetical protein